MIIKIKRFLSKPLKIKLKIVCNLPKLLVKKLFFLVVGYLVRQFMNTKIGREAFLKSVGENQILLSKTKENIYYLINSSDKVLGRTVFLEKESYDSKKLTSALDLVSNRRNTLLDVGANIGTIGIFGVSRGYFDKCIAFEPEPNNFKLLQQNVLLNNLEKKFELRNVALSNQGDGTLDFELSEDNYGDHRVRFHNQPGKYKECDRKVIPVSVNTLDSILVDVNIDDCFLFMDTQGFEGHVLSGAKNLIQKGIPIVMEFWPYGLQRADGFTLLCDALTNSKYTAMWDLRRPYEKLKFSIDNIERISLELSEGVKSTDLVIVHE